MAQRGSTALLLAGAFIVATGRVAVAVARRDGRDGNVEQSASCVPRNGRCMRAAWDDGYLRYENLQYEVLSERPRIYYYPTFLSHDECDTIRALGLPHVKASRTDRGNDEKIRSSTSFFFPQEMERASPEIMAVKHRAQAISRVNLDHQEELQIQHYKEPRNGGQKRDFYIPHYDWIPSRPRVATLLIYLEEPEHGGETIFPLVRHNASVRNAQLWTREQVEQLTLNMWNAGACSLPEHDSPWLRIRPRKGAAVLFYNVHLDNSLDALSIHGSCPVLAGRKTVLQQWLDTVWVAPIYTQGLEALWRNPSFSDAGAGAADASGNQRPLVRVAGLRGRKGSEERASICSPRGVLHDVEHSQQFSLAFMMAVEMCSPKASLSLTLTASAQEEEGEEAAVAWRVRIENCKLQLMVPGAHENVTVTDLRVNEWVHVTILAEDLSFDGTIGPHRGVSSPWDFKMHVVVAGVAGSKSVHGRAERSSGDFGRGGLEWSRSRICLENKAPDHADFAQVYVVSRQLSASELKVCTRCGSILHL